MTAKQNAWMVAGIACLFVAAIATTATAQQRNGQDSQSSANVVPHGDRAMIPMDRPMPAGGGPCPWDCEAVPDGAVGINDFLDLIAGWGTIASPCDFGNGPVGVGIEDFLDLLANWGPCP